MKRFISRIYVRRTFFNSLIVCCWMISIKLFKVVANVTNPPLCSGDLAVPRGQKSHTFTAILAVFAPQSTWRHKPWKGLLEHFSHPMDVSTKILHNFLVNGKGPGSYIKNKPKKELQRDGVILLSFPLCWIYNIQIQRKSLSKKYGPCNFI